VKVSYTQAKGGQRTLAAPVRARFTASQAEIDAGADAKVAEAVVEQAVLARSRRAVDLSDQGKYHEAQRLFEQNAAEIEAYGAKAGKASNRDLIELGKRYEALAKRAPPVSAVQKGAQRKELRALQAPAPASSSRY
jgi:hypothetical protein